MNNTILAASVVLAFIAALSEAKADATPADTSKASTESDCAQFSITGKQEQIAKLEAELEKVKRRTPRHQYSTGIESRLHSLRYELLELQQLQQNHLASSIKPPVPIPGQGVATVKTENSKFDSVLP